MQIQPHPSQFPSLREGGFGVNAIAAAGSGRQDSAHAGWVHRRNSQRKVASAQRDQLSMHSSNQARVTPEYASVTRLLFDS